MAAVEKVRAWLKGKKTYLICAGAIIALAVAWSEGNVTDFEAISGLIKAIFGMSLRAGVAKILA